MISSKDVLVTSSRCLNILTTFKDLKVKHYKLERHIIDIMQSEYDDNLERKDGKPKQSEHI